MGSYNGLQLYRKSSCSRSRKKITFTGEVELRESDEIKDLYKMLLQQSVGALLVHDDFQLNIKVELDCET